MIYMVSNIDRPKNSPIYSIHSNLDSFILYNEDEISQQEKENKGEFTLLERSKLHSIQEKNSPDFSSLK